MVMVVMTFNVHMKSFINKDRVFFTRDVIAQRRIILCSTCIVHRAVLAMDFLVRYVRYMIRYMYHQ